MGSGGCHSCQKSTTANMGLSTKPYFTAVVVITAKSVSEALITAGQEISFCELMLGNSE